MIFKIEISAVAKKTLDKLDPPSRKQILNYIDHVLSKLQKPRSIGKALVGNKSELWRYRTGHFRIVCKIKDKTLAVLILELGHRKNIYE